MTRLDKAKKAWNDVKIMIIALVSALVLWYPVAYFHELGHIIVCVGSGYNFYLTLTGLSPTTICSGQSNPFWLLFVMGGIFGVIACLTPLVIGKIRRNMGIFVGLLILASVQAIYAFFETFAHLAYLNGQANYPITIVFLCALGILFLKYGRSQKTSKEQSKEQSKDDPNQKNGN